MTLTLPRSIIAGAITAAERLPLPTPVLRAAIAGIVAQRPLPGEPSAAADAAFAAAMSAKPIALFTDEANAQHYEVPAAFFALVLGPHRKYSSCYYEDPDTTLGAAELTALELTAEHARLADGQTILELGCGWGSLSLFMAERYPNARITAVSNSQSQRAFIMSQAAARGLANLSVITADMRDFAPPEPGTYDRIVSVEMFEHMANWRALLTRIASALAPEGRIFVHVFSHGTRPYAFDHTDPADWIARYFFTGGIMPSDGLMAQFPDVVAIEDQWRWSGTHYARTARDWLANFDRNKAEIADILQAVYGADSRLWMKRWRLFFLAVEGMFAHRDGAEWGVKHYLLRRA